MARGLPETPGKELGLLPETEPVTSEAPLIWTLRLVIGCEEDRGCPRCAPWTSRLLRRRVLLELGGVWCGEREPGLLPEEDCRVTDSKIRE